jgi:hypothetical protein
VAHRRLRWISRRLTNSTTHVTSQHRHGHLHRRDGELERLRRIGAIRDDENQSAWPRAKHGRELAPKSIHVAHAVIDGGISASYATDEADKATER